MSFALGLEGIQEFEEHVKKIWEYAFAHAIRTFQFFNPETGVPPFLIPPTMRDFLLSPSTVSGLIAYGATFYSLYALSSGRLTR